MAQSLPDVVEEELSRRASSFVPKHALLVQQNVHRKDDVSSIEELLRRCGYQIHLVGVRQCTVENVLASVDQLVHDGRDNSRTFFYYAGGCDSDVGLVRSAQGADGSPYSGSISPLMLLGRLGKARGKKAIVIDGGVSGGFVGYAHYLKHLQRFFPGHLQAQGIGKPMLENYVLLEAATEGGFNNFEGGMSGGVIAEATGTRLYGRLISPLVFWLYTGVIKNREMDLANVPLPEIKMAETALKQIRERHPEIDVQKIGLRVQRDSDTSFIL